MSGGEQANRLVLLQNAVSTGKQEKTAGGRILLGGRNNKFITRYGGGPNSIGGTVGRTTIPFTDQRTGVNNPKVKLNGFYDSQALRDFNFAIEFQTYDQFVDTPLIGDATNVIDYVPSKGNYSAFKRPATTDTFDYDVNDASNPGALEN